MRTAFLTTAALAVAAQISAQELGPPEGMVAAEVERSRSCVPVLEQVEALDAELSPLAERVQRLLGVAQAVALEDERVMDQLDASDPIETQVRDWFARDQELGQRYAATLSDDIVQQRATLRAEIQQVLADAVETLQSDANARIEATGDLGARASQCDGAIFVRPVVLEACRTASGSLCDAAAQPVGTETGFRFVDAPELVWDVQELRPWTAPGPIRVDQTGQLQGARTIGYARAGNIVVSVAFSPLIRERETLAAEDVGRMQAVNDSLGIRSTHPDVVFAPALGIRASLVDPLAGEDDYVLHFGSPEEADVVWAEPAGSGAAIERTIPLGAAHVARLRAGEPITLTALRALDDEVNEAVFTIELTTVNQAQATQALLGYMTTQLDRDLTTLLQARGGA